MNFLNVVISIILMIFASRYLYYWLFHSEEHVRVNGLKRKEYHKRFIFMPQFILFGFYDKNPVFEIWINRIIGLLFVISSLIMLFVSIFGPIAVK